MKEAIVSILFTLAIALLVYGVAFAPIAIYWYCVLGMLFLIALGMSIMAYDMFTDRGPGAPGL